MNSELLKNKSYSEIAQVLKVKNKSDIGKWGANNILHLDLESMSHFIDRPVIYFLYLKNKVVYVGQTTRLAMRVHDHLKVGRFKKEFDAIGWIFVDKDEMDNIEADFIDYCKPKHNKRVGKTYSKRIKEAAKYMGIEESVFIKIYKNFL